jgi:hypothetical protein
MVTVTASFRHFSWAEMKNAELSFISKKVSKQVNKRMDIILCNERCECIMDILFMG